MTIPLERFLMLYCFPAQLAVGLTGNGLNLLVLTNRRIRSGTNWLLAMVALADCLFLLAFLPHTLQFNHWALSGHRELREFVLHWNNHVTAFANGCAFASAWFVVAVSLERMCAICWPLRARRLWTCANLCRLIFAIWALAMLASGHTHYTIVLRETKRNETSRDPISGRIQVETRIARQSAIREGWERIWGWLTVFAVLAGVLLPVLLVLLANLASLKALGHERRQRLGSGRSREDSQSQHGPLLTPVTNGHSSQAKPTDQRLSPVLAMDGAALLPRPSSGQLRHQRRATLAVLIIACTFTLSHSPSAVVILCEVCWPAVGQLHAFRTLAVLSNFLVVTGKTANHFLLCLWSAHFRRNVRLVLGQLMPHCLMTSNNKNKQKSPQTTSREFYVSKPERTKQRKLPMEQQAIPDRMITNLLLLPNGQVRQSVPIERNCSLPGECGKEEIVPDGNEEEVNQGQHKRSLSCYYNL